MNEYWIDRCHRVSKIIHKWGEEHPVLNIPDSLISMGMYESAFFAYDWDRLQKAVPGVDFIRSRDYYTNVKALRNE